MAYTLSSSTFSISSPVVIKNGTEGYGKILTTDASGLVTWKDPNSFFGTSRYIGELYGGGIVVDFWKEGDVENTLIMSLTHLSYDYVWSNIPSFNTSYVNNFITGADSIYDGRYNSNIITSQIVFDAIDVPLLSHTGSAAKMCIDYNYDGYDDWYLPSYNEFNSIIKNINIINKVLGDVDGIRSQNTGSGSALNGSYWTSTEYIVYTTTTPTFPGGPSGINTGSYAIQYSTSDSRFKQELKTNTAMVRAVRREEKLTGNGLVLSLDAGNKNSYDDSKRGNVWYDLVNKGITASAGLTFSASATGVTYSATNSGYFTFQNNQTSYIDFKVDLGNSSIVTVEMFARLRNFSTGNVFGWGYPGGMGYSVLQSGALGFWSSGDIYGLNYTKFTDYDLGDNWKHYIFVMSSEAESPSYASNKIYINGDKINLGFVIGTAEGGKGFFNGYGRINPDQGGYGAGAGMDLAVFNIYKRELNQTEIVNNFNKYKKRFEVKDKPYQKDIILNLNSNNINSFDTSNLTVWNDTKFTSDTRTLKPLTFVSNATYTKSGGVYPGTYINFISGNRASVASSITFTYSTTWEAWVKFDSILPSNFNMFMGQSLPYFAIYGTKFIFSNSYSGIVGSAATQSYQLSNSIAVTNVWYHLAFTTKYDPISNTTSSKIYINGLPDYSNTITTNGPNYTTYDSNSIPGYQINNYPNYKFTVGDGRDTTWYPFNGSISEVRIYNRTLSLSEIKNNYNSSKHLYDIDQKHYTHNFNTSPTFSIFQNLTLDFTNKQNNSILVSDSNGLVSLSTPSNLVFDKTYKRSVGDLYAGGIIVSVVDYLSTTNYLIASLEDYNFSTTYYWSTLGTSQSEILSYLNSDSEFYGSKNTNYIINSIGSGTYAAIISKTYSYGGYNDWYLPSTQELREAYNNSNILNLVLGKNSLKETYWSSTESGFQIDINPSPFIEDLRSTNAYAFNFGSLQVGIPLGINSGTVSGIEFAINKYTKLKVRPFRTEVDSNNPAFITVWKTDNSGTSGPNAITIPTKSGLIYNYNVDWGDGTKSTGLTTNTIHTYSTAGTYTVKITGTFPAIYFNNGGDKQKILQVKNWGSIKWTSMEVAFNGCSNLTITALDAPDLSNVTNMISMFEFCSSFNQSINHWDVSNVTNMDNLFLAATAFNQPLNNWNVSNVTSMSGMFSAATSFNQPLNSWNTSLVQNMSNMFRNAIVFNQPLSSWITSAVTNMSYMFYQANVFNQPLNTWNTASVTKMQYMFYNAPQFNQPLTTSGNIWNTSAVTDMSYMFCQANAFNKSLNSWNTSAVKDMSFMFGSAIAFNNGLAPGVSGPLNFNTVSVTTMQCMFGLAYSFNQTLTTSGNIWNTSLVTNMAYMFQYTSVFNQSLNSWNTSAVGDMNGMFQNANVFNNGLASGVSGSLNFDTHLVTDMSFMFQNAPAFNQTLTTSGNIWNTSLVQNMSYMFNGTNVFNQPLNSWNTSAVKNMQGMFQSAIGFNQPLSSWITSAVTDMSYMFSSATIFNQPLTTSGNIWNTSAVTTMYNMFYQANAFNQNIGSWNVSNVISFNNFMASKTNLTFSTTNLDAIYIGWASRPVKPNITISFGTAKRTAASTTARGVLTGSPNLWTITDGGI